MTKRSAMVLAMGIAVALMATAFALSATSRPGASAGMQGRRQAQVKPLVRTSKRTVKVHRTKEVPVYVTDQAVVAATDPSSVGGEQGEESDDDFPSSGPTDEPSEEPAESDDDHEESDDHGSGGGEEDDGGSGSESGDD